MKKPSLVVAALGLALSLSVSTLAGDSSNVPAPCDPSKQGCTGAALPPSDGTDTGTDTAAIADLSDSFASTIAAVLALVLP